MGLKQITSSNHLWRDSSRRAPHNLYTDIENLYQGAGTDLSHVEEKEIVLEDCPTNYGKGLEIEVIYSNSSNRVTYTYDEEKEVYLRFINDNPHLDRETEEQYRAHRVIIRKTPHQSIPGPEGLVEINLEGEGEGLLYEGGKKFHIHWEKKNDATSYYYQTGNPLETRWGNTWIQVVKSNQ